jgi:CRP/FNR family transcriptional regulator, cyclic AMP receptor protein
MHPSKLATLPLFQSLKKRQLERLSGWVDEVELDAGRTVIHEGRTAYEFFVILEGTARVLHDDEEVAVLSSGDFFGEIALEEHGLRTATVTADTPMRLAVMTEREFHLMEDEMPQVASMIRAAVEARRPS